MHKLLIIVFLFLGINSYSQTQYSKGYEQGYKEGFCYNEFGCIPPIAPIAPISKIGENTNSYKDGYQRGFVDGMSANTKGNKSNNNAESNSSFSPYTPRKYGEYIEVYDFDLMHRALEAKQRQYNNRIKEYEKQVELQNFYSETLEKAVNESRIYYQEVYGFLDLYKGLIEDFRLIQDYLKSFNPNLLLTKYPDKLSFDQVKNLINKLEVNSRKIETEIAKQAWEIFTWFTKRPNNIILGSYKTTSLIDYRFNFSTNLYEPAQVLNDVTLIHFTPNLFHFYRSDKGGIMTNIYGLSKTELDYYLFEDGLGGVIAVNKDLRTITFYYDKDLKTNQYKGKTVYNNLVSVNQSNFLKLIEESSTHKR